MKDNSERRRDLGAAALPVPERMQTERDRRDAAERQPERLPSAGK